jgi:hypothetical protein
MQHKFNCYGHAVLEFALVLPLLGLLALGGIELSRALITTQIATSLSKQIATTAYRACIADIAMLKATPPPAHLEYYNPEDCMQNVGQELNSSGQLDTVAPGVEFTLSMYIYDAGAGGVENDPFVRTWKSGAGIIVSKSNFYPALFQGPSSIYGQAAQAYEALVIAEVYVPYSSVFKRVLNIFYFDPGEIYAVTIL